LRQKLQGIRRDSPRVWDAWRPAVNYRLPAEKEAPHA
jgi:hypothetical protein